ncbi:MAG: GxxExxY protein [Spartobacteria bacterium]|nr:GxxExxY protein [Spartobacteria bacterium]
MEEQELTKKIIGCAIKVHSALGCGFLESVYQKALLHELRKAGFKAAEQVSLRVTYDGVVVGDFYADIVVEDKVIVENKAVEALGKAHEVQVVNYLTATGLNVGLLFNFGAPKLDFKRKHRIYRQPLSD